VVVADELEAPESDEAPESEADGAGADGAGAAPAAASSLITIQSENFITTIMIYNQG
jgi:hypothetical protein